MFDPRRRPARASILVAVLVVICGTIGIAGCGSPPRRSNTAACIARSRIQSALVDLNRVDYRKLNAAQLHSALSSLQQGITDAESAVNLPQNVGLRKLGGLPYLQSINSQLDTLLNEASRAGSDPSSVDLNGLQTGVAAQTREGQRIVTSINGC